MTKYFAVTFTESPSREDPAMANSSAREETFRFCAIASKAVWDWAIVGTRAAGPVGAPSDGEEELLRNRHTSRIPWNLESWNLVMAAAQAASVR